VARGLIFLLVTACATSSAEPCDPAELAPFELCGMVCHATACMEHAQGVDVIAFECEWPGGSAAFCEPFASCWTPDTCDGPPAPGCVTCS